MVQRRNDQTPGNLESVIVPLVSNLTFLKRIASTPLQFVGNHDSDTLSDTTTRRSAA